MIRNFDIFCIGKTTIDQFLVLNELTIKYHLDPRTGYLSFRHGEKISVEGFDFCIGGNATNVSVGLSRLGFNVALCSEIGEDEFSSKITNELKKENIDRSHMIVTPASPSSFSVIINYKEERTIFMQKVARENNFQLENILTKYVFLTSLEKEWRKPYEEVLRLVVKKGFKLAFNPGTLQLRDGRDVVQQIVKHTDVLFVNKEEAEEILFGKERRVRNNDLKYIHELLSKLHKLGAKVVVITNSKRGSYAIDEYGNFYRQGLFPGEVVEKTGAGDAYTAGFLGAFLLDKSIKEAMKWGAANSSAVIQKVGATAGLVKRDDLEKRIKNKSFRSVD
jgi:sugar/nucleoside kinase (ribokinase family)